MTSDHEPARWYEPTGGADRELRDLLGAARDDVLSVERVDALARSMSAVPSNPPPGPAAAAAAKGWVAKLVGVGAVTIAAVIAGSLWLQSKPTSHLERAAVVSSIPTQRTRALDPKPPAHPIDLDEPGQSADAKTKPKPGGSAIEEYQLIRAAREALPNDPARALSLARAHERRFPHGVLAQEREVLLISALKRLGQKGDADRRTDRFKQSYPDSPHGSKFDAEQP
jgi:hypothetical protein